MRRTAIALVALLLGLGALPVVGAANLIAGEPTCRDVNRGIAAAPEGGCFEGSTARRAVVVGLLYVAAAAAVSAMVLGAGAALLGTRGTLFLLAALGAVAIFFAAYGAARF